MSASRQLHLGAFMRPISIHTAAWRYPGGTPDGNFNWPLLKRLTQKLEHGKFDAFFMADHLAVPNMPPDALKRSAHRERLLAELVSADDIERYLLAQVDEQLDDAVAAGVHRGLQGAQRRLAARARALHEDLDLLHALLDALAGGERLLEEVAAARTDEKLDAISSAKSHS